MAKITHRGSWIQLKSLNKEDKKNYLISLSFFFAGALFWGVHLTTVDGIFGPAIERDNGAYMTLIRSLIIIFWIIAAIYQNKFIKAQDELMHRYYLYLGAWGGIGFVSFGMLFSILSPYLGFEIGFYECFLAWAIGTGIGGFIFDRKYLRDGE
jgi:hypothetical protein